MTQSNITNSTPSPDPLDDQLAKWGSQFECSQDQIAAMWSRVSETLVSDQTTRLETPTNKEPATAVTRVINLSTKLIHWSIELAIAASFLIAVGLGLSMLLVSHQGASIQVHSWKDTLAEFAFTAEELHEKQALAVEFQRLCLKPVLARKTTSGWDIDESPDADDSGRSQKSAMVIRCVLMESNGAADSSSETWKVVEQEEVITNREYQHMAANNHPGDVDAWLHLLPDQSLWTECHDESREEASLLHQNEPRIVWEEKSNNSVCRRFVIVYQCLDIDNV
ncbi:MAG: hypothetical protein MUC43_15325 [Pirellula sp.]|nr:hypothetical protein [Pirellula sp.]